MEIIKKPANYYSPLRYPGGKSGLSLYISRVLEKNEIGSSTYVEPFAGGAGAALNLLINEYVEKIIINDLDHAIYSFWFSILNYCDDFIAKIDKTEITISEWKKQRKIYFDPSGKIFDKGFAVFYLNRTNRSGILTGGPIGGMEQKGKWKITARFNKEKLIERIKKVRMYKNRIVIKNENAIDLLKGIDTNSDFFIYLDPPYVNKAQDLYLNHFTAQDHIQLANYLEEIKEMKWILSYDNDTFVKKLYQEYRSFEFNLNYCADKAKKGKEVVIFSDNLEPVLEL